MATSSSSSLDAAAVLKAKLLNLDKERIQIQQDIEANISILGSVGMNQPLVDAEGFPRGDIDIYAVRAARNKIICLRNDLKTKEQEIETTLPLLHSLGPLLRIPSIPSSSSTDDQNNGSNVGSYSQNTSSSSSSTGSNVANGSSSTSSILLLPFALVDAVSPDSPAANGNLRLHDKIIRFGTVCRSNGNSSGISTTATLMEVGQYVQAHANQSITVTVQRSVRTSSNDPNNNDTEEEEEEEKKNNTEIIDLAITPQRWSGPGLLGCHIIPL